MIAASRGGYLRLRDYDSVQYCRTIRHFRAYLNQGRLTPTNQHEADFREVQLNDHHVVQFDVKQRRYISCL